MAAHLGDLVRVERPRLAQDPAPGTRSLPTSWSAAAIRSTSTSASSQPSLSAISSAMTPTRAACPDECGSLASIARESASSVVVIARL